MTTKNSSGYLPTWIRNPSIDVLMKIGDTFYFDNDKVQIIEIDKEYLKIIKLKKRELQ